METQFYFCIIEIFNSEFYRVHVSRYISVCFLKCNLGNEFANNRYLSWFKMGATADSTILVPLLAVTHTFIPSACISSSGGLQGLTDSQIETIKPSWSGSGPAGPALSVTSA